MNTPRADRGSDRALVGVTALLSAVSVALVIHLDAAMPGTCDMPMPGGWTMSMVWMRMPGQTWPGAAASFLGMWIAMMVAMMLPSLFPMLRGYRESVAEAAGTRLGWLTVLVGVGYFGVWTVAGLAVFPAGVWVAALEMRLPAMARAVPFVAGTVVLIAGLVQFSAWKARRLACCREAPGRPGPLAADAGTAWRHGVHFGVQCAGCCGNLMALLMVAGVMDLRAMTVVTAAITAERLAPGGRRVQRAIGAGIAAAAVVVLARAAGVA
jgi:predicted metal-binding membrane protein